MRRGGRHGLRLRGAIASAFVLGSLWGGMAAARAQDAAACTAAQVAAADRQVRRALAAPVDVERGAMPYLHLLGCAGAPGTRHVESLLRPHVARTMLLLPDTVRAAVVRERHAAPDEVTFRRGAGEVLATWWRRHDPLPATARNERLEEHLRRLAHALEHYPGDRRAAGLDDRGLVYVRLGPPEEQHEIPFDDARFRRDVFRFGVAVELHDFPDNELWLYPSLAHAGYYLFVRRGRAYYLGTAADLVPDALQQAVGTSERDMNKAVSLLAALRYIYGQLALYHVDFSERYARVERYALWQENRQIASEVGSAPPLGQRDAEVGAGREARQVYADPTLGVEAPAAFVQEVLMQSAHADRQAVRRRAEAMPLQQAAPSDEEAAARPLPMAVRTARFLDEDGHTRVEVYWSPLPGALATMPDTSLLAVHSVRLSASYRRELARAERLAVTLPPVPDAVVPPQTMTMPLGPSTDSARYHVHLQWDQRTPSGRLLRRGVHRADGLQPLGDHPARLEMSDLRPVFWSADAAVPDDPFAASPYPFAALTPHTALALVFEVYHLTYGADDRTCSRVTYEVEQDGQRLAGGTDRRTYADRRVRDVVVVEPQDWRDARRVTLRIRVQDCVSGQQVARRLDFRVVRD